MKVLLIKMSSLGDVIHTLPAITDAKLAMPDLMIDWVIEENFQEIPRWHSGIRRIIPIALRRWRHSSWSVLKKEVPAFLSLLRAENYDLVLDAQGLWKSAMVAALARGSRVGLDQNSAREPSASWLYQQKIKVDKQQHAVERVRALFSKAMTYDFPSSCEYGLQKTQFLFPSLFTPYVIFLHGTTWETKEWPEQYWEQLLRQVTHAGYFVYLPWGNERERQRAQRLAQLSERAICLDKHNLQELASIIAHAEGVIAVDTGLGHLSAALNTPTLSIYGATNPSRTGTYGLHQIHIAVNFICAPCLQRSCTYSGVAAVKPACFSTVTPTQVWEQFVLLLQDKAKPPSLPVI